MQREDLIDLNAFIAISEERSFTRAAARLGLSQSALSHAMRRLEKRLGVSVLARTTRSVSLTESGEHLLETLLPAFGRIEEQISALTDLRERPVGNIRITASEHAVQSVLWPVASRLMHDYPDINIEISVDSGLRDIVADRFDAGIRVGEQVARDMIAVRIGPDVRLMVVATPDYLAEHGVPRVPQDLASHRCMNFRLATSGGLFVWELERAGRQVNIRVDGQFTSNRLELFIDAVLDGLGVAFLPEDTVRPYVESGQLQVVLEEWCQPFAGYHLYYPSRRQPKAAFALLIDALRYRGG